MARFRFQDGLKRAEVRFIAFVDVRLNESINKSLW